MNAAERNALLRRKVIDEIGTSWAYDCGWKIAGSHPYRHEGFGFQFLDQPIGIKDFFSALDVTCSECRAKYRREGEG